MTNNRILELETVSDAEFRHINAYFRHMLPSDSEIGWGVWMGGSFIDTSLTLSIPLTYETWKRTYTLVALYDEIREHM